MNATDLTDDYQAEACRLRDWAFAQARYYRKHAPACTIDIAAFEDIAALLDTFRAGLVLVPPHPAMHAEIVRWVRVEDALPDADETVFVLSPGDDCPWPAYTDGARWYEADGMPCLAPEYWATLPTGPQLTAPAARSTAEAPAA